LKRHLTCTLVGVLALFALSVVIPKTHFSPQGIVLPEKITLSPSSPSDIVLYHEQPAHAQVLGRLRVEYAVKSMTDETRNELMKKVNALAASVGANGVVVTLLLPGDGVRKLLIFYGTAIYVPGSKK